MSNDNILLGLTGVFREVFDDDTIVLTLNTTADDIEHWDSMSQVTLAVEVEHRFQVKLRSAEMEDMRSVAGLVELITLAKTETAP
jgi:acyl carrier protein